MGLFEGCCSKCGKHMSWFIHDGGGLKCKHCGYFNIDSELWRSNIFNGNRDLQLLFDRTIKISKIKKLINLKNDNKF